MNNEIPTNNFHRVLRNEPEGFLLSYYLQEIS